MDKLFEFTEGYLKGITTKIVSEESVKSLTNMLVTRFNVVGKNLYSAL